MIWTGPQNCISALDAEHFKTHLEIRPLVGTDINSGPSLFMKTLKQVLKPKLLMKAIQEYVL